MNFFSPKPVRVQYPFVHRLKGKARRFQEDEETYIRKYGENVVKLKGDSQKVHKLFKKGLDLII